MPESVGTVARYYHTARTAHLERLGEFTPGAFFYTKTRADFDLSALPVGMMVRQVGLWGLLRALSKEEFQVLEVPEPMAIRNWPQLLVLSGFVRIKRLWSRRRTGLVAYCIENYPAHRKLSEFTGLSGRLSKIVTRSMLSLLYGSLDRVVFGTDGASSNYAGQVPPRAFGQPSSVVIPALPQHRDIDVEAKGEGVVFLGTFERRKGFDLFCQVWPLVVEQVPAATLVVLGKGELLQAAQQLGARAEVALQIDPSRDEIWDRLAFAKVLVLPSQPARGFREQVGLPIVEALSSGCEVVASNETGIAAWLSENGHRVLPPGDSPESWARAIAGAVSSASRAATILDSLPETDGRLAADRFLMRTDQD